MRTGRRGRATSRSPSEQRETRSRLLAPLLGTGTASLAFAVALLASGQSSTVTGTLAGQVVMEGFLRVKLSPVLRHVVTRALAVVPAVVALALYDSEGRCR